MKRIFIIIVTFCFFSMPSIAHACSCIMSDAPSAFNSAKTVFIGRMLGGTEKLSANDEKGNASQLEAGAVRFNVEELFKGNISNEITITIDSMKGTSCGDYGLKRGELYLVYAYGSQNDENLLYSGVCTRTSEINNQYIKEDLEFLRKLPAAGTGGNLRGRIWADVKKVYGGGAEPLSNVKVNIRGADGKVIVATTDKNGEFEIKKIKAGKYRVEPQLPQNYYIEESFEDVEVADRGTADAAFEAYFTGRAAGRIVDKNGVGYNDAFLHFLSINEDKDQRNVYGHSDGENGDFSIEGVPPGEYVLFLEFQHKDYNQNSKYYYPGTFERKEAKIIKVGLGGKVEGLNFVLPDEFQVKTIEGQAFWKDGKPATDIEILLLCPQSALSNGLAVEMMALRTQTNNEGKYKFEGFTGESYWIEARGAKEDNKFYSPARKIVLTENLKNINLVLSENGFSRGCQQ